MESLRKLTALILAISLANYGVLASAVAHAHETTGFHQVHLLDDDGHHHDHEEMDDQQDRENNEPNAPEHSETGFHSHSSPQFGPIETATLRVAFLMLPRDAWVDPSGVNPLHKDRPPFKPPRTIL